MSMLRNVLTYMGLGPDEDYDDGYLDEKPARRGRHSRQAADDPVDAALDLDQADSDGGAATDRAGAGATSMPGTTAEVGARAAAARNASAGRGSGSVDPAGHSGRGSGNAPGRSSAAGGATARSAGTAAPGASGDTAPRSGARPTGAHDVAPDPKAGGPQPSGQARVSAQADAASPSASKATPATRSTAGSPGNRSGGAGHIPARGAGTPSRPATAGSGAATSSGPPPTPGPANRSGAETAAAANRSTVTPAGGSVAGEGTKKAAPTGATEVNGEGGAHRQDERAAELRARAGGGRPLRAVPPPGGSAQDLVQPENGITVRAVSAEADMASESAAYQTGAPPLRRVTPRHLSPQSFGDAKTLADEFKADVPVIMNLQGTERELSRRLIDFASGICYALEGSMEKIAPQVFLLTPPAVTVSDEDRRRFERPGRHQR